MIIAVSEHLDIINCIGIEYPRFGAALEIL
jgi:hypothetical protein